MDLARGGPARRAKNTGKVEFEPLPFSETANKLAAEERLNVELDLFVENLVTANDLAPLVV